jgi:hypothetical protein
MEEEKKVPKPRTAAEQRAIDALTPNVTVVVPPAPNVTIIVPR